MRLGWKLFENPRQSISKLRRVCNCVEDGLLQIGRRSVTNWKMVCYKIQDGPLQIGRRSATKSKTVCYKIQDGLLQIQRRSATNWKTVRYKFKDGLLQNRRRSATAVTVPACLLDHQSQSIFPLHDVADHLPSVQLCICCNQHYEPCAEGPQWCCSEPRSGSGSRLGGLQLRAGCSACCCAPQAPGHPEMPGCGITACSHTCIGNCSSSTKYISGCAHRVHSSNIG